ncbi:hypothetical protein ES706_06386 [subsurface metagenome]
MYFICSSGNSRKRKNITIRSALLRTLRPGISSSVCGSISPVSLLMAKSTVHLKPWCTAKILASWGIKSSERYSSSPMTKTMCLPWPGPLSPLKTTLDLAFTILPSRQVNTTNTNTQSLIEFLDLFIFISFSSQPNNCYIHKQTSNITNPVLFYNPFSELKAFFGCICRL